ncbi:hypothetical protein [Guillardia theta]|uniref:Uncharacterized protein n=1 Tax=Guillardia theta TaxID=55529 RepID=Q9AVZ1_GUITH|nr:hypothetical protein GTHECHR2172 [Guillardia theta]CAC27080.1 hypothetical protein [Guillardia theta]
MDNSKIITIRKIIHLVRKINKMKIIFQEDKLFDKITKIIEKKLLNLGIIKDKERFKNKKLKYHEFQKRMFYRVLKKKIPKLTLSLSIKLILCRKVLINNEIINDPFVLISKKFENSIKLIKYPFY